MSIVNQFDPSGKEIQIGDKKYTQDSKITFNIKAFVSLVIIIGAMFLTTYYFIDKRITESSENGSAEREILRIKLDQLEDEKISNLKEQVDATNGKMELLMMLINSNQIDIDDIHPAVHTVEEARAVDPASNLPDLDTISTGE